MKGHAPRFVAIAVVAVGLLGPGAQSVAASPHHADRPCGSVSFDYQLPRVRGGQLMDMSLGIENCSSQSARFRLRVRSSGRCTFPHPVSHTYGLPGHFAVFSSALIVPPSCPGRYSVHVRLTPAGERAVLDTGGDGFSVR
jgi:hypothetical protein